LAAGTAIPAAATKARHQATPAYTAAPSADSNVTGRPHATAASSASRAIASPCTITARPVIMLDVQAVARFLFKPD
jgi:hypothetical protein